MAVAALGHTISMSHNATVPISDMSYKQQKFQDTAGNAGRPWQPGTSGHAVACGTKKRGGEIIPQRGAIKPPLGCYKYAARDIFQ